MNKGGLKEKLDRSGALIFGSGEVPLGAEQWAQLETIARQVDYEHIIGGDAGEGHSVYVSRFVNDVVEPVDLQPQANTIKNIVMNDDMQLFYKSFLGGEALCLRRCQANLLKKSDYIGKHIDQHSNPDYIASVVFHFDSDYQGGDFISQPDSVNETTFHPKPHSVVVNNGHCWHEVEAVVSGERRTLACFFSNQFGRSQNNRQEFEISN